MRTEDTIVGIHCVLQSSRVFFHRQVTTLYFPRFRTCCATGPELKRRVEMIEHSAPSPDFALQVRQYSGVDAGSRRQRRVACRKCWHPSDSLRFVSSTSADKTPGKIGTRCQERSARMLRRGPLHKRPLGSLHFACKHLRQSLPAAFT